MNILQKEHFFVPWIHPFPHLLRPFIVSFWPWPICSNLQDGTHCQVPGRNPVPLCFLLSMTANGSFRTLILCHMWNGRLYIGGLQEIISQGEIASIRQINMVMSQTSKGKQKHNNIITKYRFNNVNMVHSVWINNAVLWDFIRILKFKLNA